MVWFLGRSLDFPARMDGDNGAINKYKLNIKPIVIDMLGAMSWRGF